MSDQINTTILFIGDPHIKVDNLPEVDEFILKIKKKATEISPNIIIIAGDILHTHERVHTFALNKAYELVKVLREVAPVYVLVGNHDYCNNQQFLTTNHWLNAMKEWNNVFIVDIVVHVSISNLNFVMVPYVPPGRFEEALNTLEGFEWKNADCIFAHQEFSGCKMGAIVSIEGDKWDQGNPMVVSGHIHSKQKPQSNLFYPGASIQTAFGESENTIVMELSYSSGQREFIEHDLGLTKKKTVSGKVSDFKTKMTKIDKNTKDKIRLTLTGDYNDFKLLKSSTEFKEAIDKGIKVVFKPDKISHIEEEKVKQYQKSSFEEILSELVIQEKNKYVFESYDLIVNNKSSDILFL